MAASTPGTETVPGDQFSVELESWLRSDGPKTIGAMNDVFGEKSFAVAIVLLMIVPALPLPTGGITHVFEAMTVLLGGQMVLGRRTIWLPSRWKRRELGALTTGKALPFVVRRVRQVERFSRPRGVGLIRQPLVMRVIGLVLTGFALGAALAPPFSGLDTLPALGAVLVALAVILEDAVVLAVGVAVGLGGIALILTIGVALARFFKGLL